MRRPLLTLDLFSGIGGFSYGLERLCGGFQTVAFCEREPFCHAVLRRHWPGVPIHDDVRTLDGHSVGPVGLITGGVPCQPTSRAGRQRGADDDRWLWPQALRIVEECRPRWILFENPPGIYDVGIDGILSQLEGFGYANYVEGGRGRIAPVEIPACAVNASHGRNRVWIVAHAHFARQPQPPWGRTAQRGWAGDTGSAVEYATSNGWDEGRAESGVWRGRTTAASAGGAGGDVGHPYGPRPQKHPRQPGDDGAQQPAAVGTGWGDDEWLACHDGKARRVPGPLPVVCGVADGLPAGVDGTGRPTLTVPSGIIPHRMKRIAALGNAVHPQVVAMIGRAILAADQGEVDDA